MYSSEQFLRFAREYLGIEIGAESVEQVRDTAELLRQPGIWVVHSRIPEEAVMNWLRASYPEDEILRNEPGFPDIIRIDHGNGVRFGYEVKSGHASSFTRYRWRDALDRGCHEVRRGSIDEFNLVIVVDQVELPHLATMLRKMDVPDEVSVLVGFLVRVGEPSEHWEFRPAALDEIA
jgi:hypothetical protein